MSRIGSARARVTSVMATRSAGVSSSPVPSSPRSRAVPRATLATSRTSSMVPIPASRLPPPRSSPITGSLPTQTPARCPRKQSLASSSPVSSVIGLPSTCSSRSIKRDPLSASRSAAVANATTTSTPASSHAVANRRTVRTAEAARSAGTPPVRATSVPRWRKDRRRSTGTRRPSCDASTTIRWKELLPRSKTATRTVGIGVTLSVGTTTGERRSPPTSPPDPPGLREAAPGATVEIRRERQGRPEHSGRWCAEVALPSAFRGE